MYSLRFYFQFRLLLEKGKGDLSTRCSKCPADGAENCSHHPVQQGEVSSTEPPLPESSTNGGQPEISAYFEAVEHYISSAGWVLLEINAEGVIECVSENIKDLIQFTRQDLQNQSIYSYLHPGDHKILSPILNNMTFSLGWDNLDDVDGPGGAAANNDNNNNNLTGENCFGGASGTNGGGASGLTPNPNDSSNGGMVLASGGGSRGSGGQENTAGAGASTNNSSAGLSPKRSIRSRIRMLLKHVEQETVEQKQRRQDKYEEVVIIAAPVRDGDECSSVLCLITRPEDENLGDNPNTVHSQVQQHHNQHINAQQPPQLLAVNLEQLTVKLDPSGKILSYNMMTLRESFQKHLGAEPPRSLMELCHYQDVPKLQKHLSEVMQSGGPHHTAYRLRLGSPDIYVTCKTQSKVFESAQPGDSDFIMAVHTILHESDLAQSNLMGASGSSSNSNTNNNNNSNSTSTISGILMSPSGGGSGGMCSSQMMGSNMLYNIQQQQHSQQMGGHTNVPNYFQAQQNKLMQGSISNGNMNNNNNYSSGHGMGGPLMTSVINGSGAGGGPLSQQQQLQNRVPLIKPDPNNFTLDLEEFAENFTFDIDDFEASPVSRASLTPVNTSRPPSVSAVYSPLPTPLTPFQVHQPNNTGDPMQASPGGGGGQTPSTQPSGYGATASGAGSFSFPGFGDDSQGSNVSAKDKQQLMVETTRLRTLLTNRQSSGGGAGSSSAGSPPSGIGGQQGSKKGGAGTGAKKNAANDSRQANQILKVSEGTISSINVVYLNVVFETVIVDNIQNLPRRLQGLLNSDEETKEAGAPVAAAFSGPNSSRPQIPQSPGNRRGSENSKILVQVSKSKK